MAMEEITRRALRDKLDGLMGEEYAAKLMGYLPGAEPATKEDLNSLRHDMHGDLHSLRQDLNRLREATKADLDRLRQSMDERFESMNQRFESMNQRFESMNQRFESSEERFDSKLEGMEGRLRADFHKELSALGLHIGEQIGAQTRNYIFSMVGAMIALATATRLF